MPLGDDQKAMLRLLAREQSYEDIAALMGLSVDEVVTRAKGAVLQLEAEGIPAPALPDAPGAAAEPAPPVEEPAPRLETTGPSSEPSEAGKPAARNRLIALGGGVAALVVIIVGLVVVINGGSDSGGDSTGQAAADRVAVGPNEGPASRQPTTAQLEAVDGSDASGSAEFGRVDDSLALGIEAEGVEAAPKQQTYMVWLAESRQKMLPLTAVVANRAGRINASYEVPTEAVIYLASGDFDRLVITRTENERLRRSLVRANQEKEFPTYTGDPVLEGEIVGPIIGAAERLERRQRERRAGE